MTAGSQGVAVGERSEQRELVGTALPVTALVPAQRSSATPIALAALPPAAVESVRAAYGREVLRRLPALEAVMLQLTAGNSHVDLPTAIRDAHSLASSSVVVGEATAATALRDVEDLLTTGAFEAAAARLHVAAQSLGPWRSGIPA